MSAVTPTRAALFELKAERAAMAEGFRLLDDKRLLLAAELLRGLARYAEAWRELAAGHQRAAAALREALARHGLEGLQCYPAERITAARLALSERRLFGVRLREAGLECERSPAPAAAHPSPEAERCRGAYRALARPAAEIAALSGNLRRLADEYRSTERRARALEDVLIPEVDALLRSLEERLDEGDQEETAHVHRAHGRAGAARLT